MKDGESPEGKNVGIQLLGEFVISVSGEQKDNLAVKSRKGISLMTYLVLQRGKAVSSQRLIRELWGSKHNESPENALKTMVSRLRALLNSVSPGLGNCIQSEQGAYRWEGLPYVHVDVMDFMDLVQELKKPLSDEERRENFRRIAALYQGDLFQTGDMINGAMHASWMHREYLEAMYAYVNLLKEREEYNEIVRVCEQALRIDELDEFLRIELMRAMVSLNRARDAADEYRRVTALSRRYLDADPSEDFQQRYRQLAKAGSALQFNLDAIRNELIERDSTRRGPFFCDYQAFKEIYNIQMRNLERLGSTMFLGVIMVGDPGDEDISSVQRESAMAGLQEILRRNLRKGDIVTRFAPAIFALLLPTVNYSTGGMVMERMEEMFYAEYPNRSVALHYRISPLGSPANGAAG